MPRKLWVILALVVFVFVLNADSLAKTSLTRKEAVEILNKDLVRSGFNFDGRYCELRLEAWDSKFVDDFVAYSSACVSATQLQNFAYLLGLLVGDITKRTTWRSDKIIIYVRPVVYWTYTADMRGCLATVNFRSCILDAWRGPVSPGYFKK